MRLKSPAWIPGRRHKSIGDSFNLGRWEAGKRRRAGLAYEGGIPMTQETMLTAQDVAARWGVCVQTVYRLAAKRDGLPAYKVGRCIRFKADEVAAYLENQAVKPPELEPGMKVGRFQYKPGMKVVSI